MFLHSRIKFGQLGFDAWPPLSSMEVGHSCAVTHLPYTDSHTPFHITFTISCFFSSIETKKWLFKGQWNYLYLLVCAYKNIDWWSQASRISSFSVEFYSCSKTAKLSFFVYLKQAEVQKLELWLTRLLSWIPRLSVATVPPFTPSRMYARPCRFNSF